MDSRVYLGKLMHGETATWHSASMHADVLVMQEIVGFCSWVGQEDPICENSDTNGVTGVTCMVMWECNACDVMRTCMVQLMVP